MSTQTTSGGGPLHFEALIGTEQYDRALTDMERRMIDFSKTGEQNTARVDKAMEQLGATIRKVPTNITEATKALNDQKAIIQQIERDIANTQSAIGKLGPGKDQHEMILELNAQKQALEEEKVTLQELEVQLKQTGGAKVSYRSRIRDLLIEMADMEQAGKRNTAEFEALRNEAARLQDAIDDVTQQTRILANDQAGFQGVISGVSGLTGAFAAGGGVMGLFNTRNEELMKIQTRVQSLMAITIGLQQVSNTLNKDSAFQVVAVGRAKQAWARSQTFLNSQLGISVGLTRALMFSGIGLLIAGVGALVMALSRWSRAQRENSEVQQQMQEVTQRNIASMAKEKAAIENNLAVLKSSNATYQEKYDALKQLQGIMPNYNADLDKEGNLINSNTEAIEAYIAALERSTYIRANEERLEALFTEQMQIRDLIKETEEAERKAQEADDKARRRAAAQMGRSAERRFETGESPEQARLNALRRQVEAYEQDLIDVEQRINEARQGFVDGLKDDRVDLEITMMNFDQLIIEWLNRGNIDALDEARRRLTTENALKEYISSLESIRGDLEFESDQYNKVVAEIEALRKIEQVDIVPDIEDSKKNFIDQLREIREEYEMFYQWIEFVGDDVARDQFAELIKNGDSFLAYLNRQIAELEKKKAQQGLNEQETQQLVDLSVTRQNLIGGKSEIERFREELEIKKEGYQSLSDYIEHLEKKIRLLSETESEFSLAKTGILSKELEDARNKQNNIFNQLLRDTESFEQKILAIKEEYAEKRRILNEGADKLSDGEFQRRLALLTKMEEEEINSENRIAAEKSDLFRQLHQQVLGYGRRELRERIEIIRKILDAERQKAEALGITNDLIGELELALKDAELTLGQLTSQSFLQIASGFRSISHAARTFNDDLGEAFETMAGLAESAAEAASGIALLIASSGSDIQAWGMALGGVAKLVAQIVQMFRDDSLERVLAEIEAFNLRVQMGEYTINELYRERLRTQLAINNAQLEGLRLYMAELRNQSADIKSEFERLFNELMSEDYLADISSTRRNFWQRLFGDNYEISQEWKSLMGKSYEEIEQLFLSGQLSEKAEELFRTLQRLKEEGIDIERQLEELRKRQQELFTGTTSLSIAQSIADGFASGKRTLEEFAKDFENLMRQAIISGFSSRYIQPALDDFYEMFAAMAMGEVGPDGRRRRKGEGFAGLTEDQIAALRERYGEIIDQLADQFDLMQQIAGIDFSEANQGLSGAIKGITEQTAGKLEGYINAMRIAQAQQINIVTSQLSALNNIANNTSFNRHLEEIRDILKQDPNKSNRAKGFA